jgi:hypothetical protein
MSGKATDVSINWYLHPRIPAAPGERPNFRDLNFTVKFFSVKEKAWCEFSLTCAWEAGLSGETYVYVKAPVQKRIKLRHGEQPFKVGKVQCRLTRSLLGKYTCTVGGQKWPLGRIGKG